MKIAVIMGREPSYTRNKVILDGLAAAGIEVVPYLDDGRRYPLRLLRVLARFVRRPPRDVDAVFVGFFGQPLMPFVQRLTRKPIVFDAFLSSYDTMCFDRRRCKPRSLPGRLFYRLDRSACLGAARVLLDTEAHIDYFVRTFGLERERFSRLFVGAEADLFAPMEDGGAAEDDGVFRVFYYCTYHPLHGTEYVVRAAHLLQDFEDIRFTLVGTGQERPAIDRLARELGITNTEFVDWLDYRDLPAAIARADVCLGGHFAPVEKAGRVIAGKSFQFLAMRRAVIAGDNPANHELLTHGEDTWMVKMADARSLADGILALKDDPALRERIAANGYRTFREQGTPEVIGRELAAVLDQVVD